IPKTITVDEQDPLAHSPRKRAPVHANRFKIDEHFQSARYSVTCSAGPTLPCCYNRHLRGVSCQPSS
ncbi:hypothetical protein L210DRAFT_3560061, partial [Boletus edulis BED1]